MGFQDRDYTNDHQRRANAGWGGESYERRGLPRLPRTAVGWLLLINVAIYLFDWLTSDSFASTYGEGARFTDWLSLPADQIFQPLGWYRFLTCGFAHAPEPSHIICNMLMLFFLGPAMERRYGTRSFLFVYLALIVFSALFWCAGQGFAGVPVVNPSTGEAILMPDGSPVWLVHRIIGASGAVTGIVMLFALNYPRAKMLFFFVIPMPMWLVAVIILGMDMSGALGHPVMSGGATGPDPWNIAFSAHIGGAIGALVWWKFCAGRPWFEKFLDLLTPPRWRWQRIGGWRPGGGRPTSFDRLYPTSETSTDAPTPRRPVSPERVGIDAEVDRILKKYGEQGSESLTDAEQETLRRASEIYRKG